ncbi:MAG: DUF5677 domain-containing protein [Armatimonadetes bacterium]|nr:DUF5677 domain-containing protein [Armatimonadota bacterium]
MGGLDPNTIEVLHLLEETATVLEGRITSLTCAEDELCAKGAYVVFFIKTTRIFRAFSRLLQQGFGPEAELLIRPFFETFVDWQFIETDPQNLGKRYLMHQAASRLQYLRDKGRIAEAQSDVQQYGDPVKEFCENYRIKKGRVPTEWYDKNPEYRAKKSGLAHFQNIYKYHSDLLHNSPVMLSKYVEASNTEPLQINNGPLFDVSTWWIGFVCLVFGLCLQKANQHFNLDADRVLEQARLRLEPYTKAAKPDS